MAAQIKGKVAVSAFEEAAKQNSAEQWKGRENDAGVCGCVASMLF